ncbi:MAG TPA: FtsX-like permease family protein [Ktedonobacteraceae bacterium]|nr:FtsX-like permease family protein [Ktedonobacteraceae bacterium]
MVPSTSLLARQSYVHQWSAIARLAGWRFRQMWRFLLVTWLGMLAMVVLACAPPLFSQVAISADLRNTAATSPDGQSILVSVTSIAPTNQQVSEAEQQLDHLLKQGALAPYLHAAPQLIVQTSPLSFSTTGKNGTEIVLDGYDPTQTAQHATVLQGRLPRDTNDGTIEIAITQELASNLGIRPGATITSQAEGIGGRQDWKLRLVGIIAPPSKPDPFWLSAANPFGPLYPSASGAPLNNVLAAREPVRAKIANLQIPPGKDGTHLIWNYPFDVSHLDANAIPALSQQTSDLDFQIANTLGQIPNISYAIPTGSLFDILSTYATRILVLQIVIASLLVLILAIILFLVGIMGDMLVERQAAIIAILRSRGATQEHIFGAFIVQGLVIGLAALLAGPLLAILLVQWIASLLLTPENQATLNIITAHPLDAALTIKWYALVAVGVAFLVMLVAINRSSKLDIVSLRRESARSSLNPLWRRLNLDLFAIVVIIAGYIAYSFLWQGFIVSQSDNPIIYNLAKVVGFIAPPLLVAALLMLFLRLFPFILQLAAALAAKKRSASAVLAIVQIQRTSRPAARIVVLLALAIASSCFLLTLMTTKQVRTSETASFDVGADFNGALPSSDANKSFDALKTQYATLPGVQSATVGYSDDLSNPLGDILIFGVDANTYAHTAIWPAQNSAQPLSNLTSQLVAHRNDVSKQNVVYALVDSTLWQKYALTPGASFTLDMNETHTLRVTFVALAEVNSIPGTYNTPANPDSDIGLIVDYQSYASVYTKALKQRLVPNTLWLRTSDDAASLAQIRTLLPNLKDRRLLTQMNQENSTHIDIIGALAIGVGAALILALIGTLLSSWLNAFNRLTGFALMRAIGMAPRQIAALMLWEQGFVYILGFLLGIGMGALLIVFVAPAVTLLDLSGPSALYNPFDLPPLSTVIPYVQIGILLGGLGVICLIALLSMGNLVARLSLGQRLRINED